MKKRRGPKPDVLRITLNPEEALDRLFSAPKGTRKQMATRLYAKRKRKVKRTKA